MYKNARILVTGGTGSFGHTFIKHALNETDAGELVVYSRDEKKQYEMRNELNNDRVSFVIGDVRDRDNVRKAMRGIDFVFHAAALKQVPSCEFFPMEAVRTNIIGSDNVMDAAESEDVKKVVVLGTDKAVYPINSMGMTKALMEKLVVARSLNSSSGTVFCGVRYGNVMYSRGSVIPLFVNQLRSGKPLTLTHPEMTRFLLPLARAVELVLFAMEKASRGDIFVRKAPASTVETLAHALSNIFGVEPKTEVIGIREGEKMHETLVTREELLHAREYEEYFGIPSIGRRDYREFFSHGHSENMPSEDYNSENTTRLSVSETEELLLSLPEIQEELAR